MTDACLAAAYEKVNPDAHPPCPVFNAPALHACLTKPSVTSVMILSNLSYNTSTIQPPGSDDRYIITRNITVFSDGRGPRLTWDCGLVIDKYELQPGQTITVQHVILANCSIGSEKPLGIVRLDAGSQLVINDTMVLQPPNLCLPLQQEQGTLLHATRPATLPGLQMVQIGEPQKWCAKEPGTRTEAEAGPAAAASNSTADLPSDEIATATPGGNSSYGATFLPPLPQVYAARTGLGPASSATLDQPAFVPYFFHPT